MTGLRKHLSGGKASGGHDMPPAKAQALALQVVAGHAVAGVMAPAAIDEVLTVLHQLSDESAADFLRRLLVNLVADKRLPKYQFERRFDCLFSPFLPAIAAHVLGFEASLVVPEFPLKKSNSNQSTNADHLLMLRNAEGAPLSWLLVELKTDATSYSPLQADIYKDAIRDGWPRLRSDLEQIRQASKAKEAYTHLIARVDGVAGSSPPDDVEVLYITPSSKPPHGFHSVHFAELVKLTLGPNEQVWEVLKTLVLPELH